MSDVETVEYMSMFQQPGGMQWQMLHLFDHFSPMTEAKF